MITIDDKYMDDKEFEKFYPVLKNYVKEAFMSLKVDFEFAQTPCLGEDEPHVLVIFDRTNDGNLPQLFRDFMYSEEAINKEEGWRKEFGIFRFSYKNETRENVTNVEIGDLVLIDHDYSEESSVGVVSAIIDTEEGRLFGCSYFSVMYCGEYESKFVRLTQEDYGGYKKGFAKKISKKEAENILWPQLDKAYNEKIEGLKNDKKRAEEFMRGILNDLTKKKCFTVEKSKRLKIKDKWSWDVDKSLRERSY